MSSQRRRHLLIPDTQVKPGIGTEYLNAIGNYAAAKRPDVIVQIGDFADMASLSSYDRGKKSFEGRRYKNDIQAAKDAMWDLMRPIFAERQRRVDNKKKQWNPELHLTLGNHEHRIDRAVNDSPELDGVIGISDLGYSGFGWTVHDFLVPVTIDGIVYCHYFVSGPMGRPVGTAQRLIMTKHQSCIAGHQQGRQIATGFRADGKQLTSIIAGSCYEHDEDYMGPQGNKHWRGIVMLNEVDDGSFDEMFISLDYLKREWS
jgi:hypothetical protein